MKRCTRSSTVLIAMVVLPLSLGMSTAAAADERYYGTVPAPASLAEHLFPPRYRNETTAEAGADPLAALPIRFRFDSTAVLPESLPYLESVGEMLLLPRVRERGLRIEGHTDGIGYARYNEHLSLRRAIAIRAYLNGAFGIELNRIEVIGSGERKPLDPGDPNSPLNRRVTLGALP